MATTIQNPTSQALLPPPMPDGRPQVPDEDAQRLNALVRANLSNIDRVSLEHIVHRAYRMGSERCHRVMFTRVGDQPVTLADVERRAIERAFSSAHGDVVRTAKLLGIGRSSAYRKLKKYGILTPHHDRCPNCGCNLRLPLDQ
jgi:transcriptional regulator of acetoin/glycerol metabolism